MKIQCDVCNKDEASVFCSADEAALCDGCDHRVHHANKLASKHNRFSLLHPSSLDAPLCDVCQERRAFLFCKEDRAILCRDCDLPIHTANEHTQKHSRFLLTGVKLSSSTITTPTTNTTTSSSSDAPVDSEIINTTKTNNPQPQPLMEVPDPSPPPSSSTSSISEYLIDMLPGWHVEDFLDSSSTTRPNNGFCKMDDFSPLFNSEFETDLRCFPTDDFANWVPQAPTPVPQIHRQIEVQKNANANATGLFKEVINTNQKSNKKWSDHGFTVPEINPPSNKRSRLLW